mmetsp:Transcript_63099/g.169177  ORF Transcript_63099/g.169177 Transcript_63099/m.169177 type:complete len:440 (+) Transcript_63099:4117-5436(+)
MPNPITRVLELLRSQLLRLPAPEHGADKPAVSAVLQDVIQGVWAWRKPGEVEIEGSDFVDTELLHGLQWVICAQSQLLAPASRHSSGCNSTYAEDHRTCRSELVKTGRKRRTLRVILLQLLSFQGTRIARHFPEGRRLGACPSKLDFKRHNFLLLTFDVVVGVRLRLDSPSNHCLCLRCLEHPQIHHIRASAAGSKWRALVTPVQGHPVPAPCRLNHICSFRLQPVQPLRNHLAVTHGLNLSRGQPGVGHQHPRGCPKASHFVVPDAVPREGCCGVDPLEEEAVVGSLAADRSEDLGRMDHLNLWQWLPGLRVLQRHFHLVPAGVVTADIHHALRHPSAGPRNTWRRMPFNPILVLFGLRPLAVPEAVGQQGGSQRAKHWGLQHPDAPSPPVDRPSRIRHLRPGEIRGLPLLGAEPPYTSPSHDQGAGLLLAGGVQPEE